MMEKDAAMAAYADFMRAEAADLLAPPGGSDVARGPLLVGRGSWFLELFGDSQAGEWGLPICPFKNFQAPQSTRLCLGIALYPFALE